MFEAFSNDKSTFKKQLIFRIVIGLALLFAAVFLNIRICTYTLQYSCILLSSCRQPYIHTARKIRTFHNTAV